MGNHLLLERRSSKTPSKMTMKWKILSSLVLLAVPAILVSASYEDENEDIDEFERLRRVPMIMPQNYFYRAPMASFMDYNDEESELGESDRRKKSVYRYFDFGDDEDDDFNRRKKSLYMLPRMSWSPYDKKGAFWKRFFPIINAYLPDFFFFWAEKKNLLCKICP